MAGLIKRTKDPHVIGTNGEKILLPHDARNDASFKWQINEMAGNNGWEFSITV